MIIFHKKTYYYFRKIDFSWCTELLYFDKTKNLNGYHLRAALINQPGVIHYDAVRQGLDKCSGANLVIICTVLDHINATITVETPESSGFLTEGEQYQEILNNLLSEKVQVSMASYVLKSYWKLQLYPYTSAGIKMLSLNNALEDADRFLFIFDFKILLFLVLFSFIPIFFFKKVLQQSLSKAALEFVRVLASSSTLTEPKISRGRIIFMIMVLIGLAIGISVQSILQAIYTVPRHRFIDSMDDLIKSNMPIYRLPYSLQLLFNETLGNRLRASNSTEDCANRLKEGENVICIYGTDILYNYVPKDSRIHISKENLFEAGTTYTTGEDSPLHHRMNWILSRLSEAGIMKMFHERNKIHDVRSYNRDNSNQYHLMKNFKSSFYILLGGWISAVFAIFGEITTYKIKKWNI